MERKKNVWCKKWRDSKWVGYDKKKSTTINLYIFSSAQELCNGQCEFTEWEMFENFVKFEVVTKWIWSDAM